MLALIYLNGDCRLRESFLPWNRMIETVRKDDRPDISSTSLSLWYVLITSRLLITHVSVAITVS